MPSVYEVKSAKLDKIANFSQKCMIAIRKNGKLVIIKIPIVGNLLQENVPI